jgi:hypothetical protein
MHLRYDRLYLFRSSHGGPSYCWLRIYTAPGQTVVLATELDENPGTSITNMAERLATEVTRTFGLALDTLLWIEHYPARQGLDGRPQFPESFDQVTFTRTSRGLQCPQWRRLSQAHVEILLGQTLPPWRWAKTGLCQRQEVP